jgi:hypothetical protein
MSAIVSTRTRRSSSTAARSGQSQALLQSLNKLLGVKVVGFKQKVAFCPPPAQNGRFRRAGTKAGVFKSGFTCGSDSTAGAG